MGRIFRAEPASKAKVAIVVSRFNEPLCAQLLEGALAKLHEHDGQAGVYWVPGAFEIPQAVGWLLAVEASASRRGGAQSPPAQTHGNNEVSAPSGGRQGGPPTYDGICTLGCLIRGETDHYSVLASEVTRRLGELSVKGGIPIAFGVLTCRTPEQAAERADPARENKGGEVMQALLEMIDLHRSF